MACTPACKNQLSRPKEIVKIQNFKINNLGFQNKRVNLVEILIMVY
jgi:hypothetical protein